MLRFQYPNAQQEYFSKQIRKKERDENYSNQKKNYQLMEIRKSHHQEYMLNSNTVINECNKYKDDTAMHRNINKKETNESINNNDRRELKQKLGRRVHVQLREALCWDILMKLECPENLR